MRWINCYLYFPPLSPSSRKIEISYLEGWGGRRSILHSRRMYLYTEKHAHASSKCVNRGYTALFLAHDCDSLRARFHDFADLDATGASADN